MPHPSSISHAVLPRSVVVFFRYPFTLSSHCSRVCPHSQFISSFPSLPHVQPSVALCFVFLLCCWCCCLFLVIGRLHPLVLPLRFSFTTCFPSPHVKTKPCCSPISARPSVPPHCITLSFTLRRASHLKPPNIYYSPSPPLHCKIYTFLHRPYTLLSLYMIVNIHFTADSVAIRAPSDKCFNAFSCTSLLDV